MERIRMTDVIPLIGIPGPKYGRTSYNIPCPCCDTEAHKKHLNINLEKDVFRCPRCGFAGGVFDLYVQYTGATRKNVREEILERMGSGSRRSRIYIPPAPDLPQPAEECPITDVDTRHETYTALYRKTYIVKNMLVEVRNEEIGEALQYIVPKKRSVLLLSYFLEYSDADIARLLNVSAPTVARRKKAALSELKQLIGGTYHAG